MIVSRFPERGVSLPRGRSLSGGGLPREMGLCPGGLYPGGGREDGDPPMNRMTHASDTLIILI